MTLATEITLGSPDSAAAPAQAEGANDGALVLGLLTAVEREPQVTQRRLSSDLGIALGLANAILKRCVRHGLIKISQAPFNRYSYYLTPTGFAEKTRLTVAHLRYSFNLFRDARMQYVGLLRVLAAKNVQRIGLLGASELAEAAVLSAREVGVTIVAVYDRACSSDTFVGVPVVRDIAAMAGQVAALLLSDMRDPHAAYGEAVEACEELGISADKVLAPALLSISAARAAGADDAP